MDCPSCTNKIESAVCALPGVGNVSLNYSSQKLKLEIGVGGDAASVKMVIRKLGYKVRENVAPIAPKRWFETSKGRLVIAAGAILAVATVLSVLVPAYAGYVFAAGALLALAPLAKKAFSAARVGQPFTIEMLVVIAVIGAIMIEESAEASVVVFLFLIGEVLEAAAAAKARASVSALADLVPKSAFLVQGDSIVEVEANTLSLGDIIEVRPGGRVPADGTLTMGESAIDEAAITGESMPRHKTLGDSVFAGSINTDSLIRLEVTQAAENNMISKILQMVEDAEAAKAPTARFIERFSTYYTPGVIATAALIAFLPPLFGADLETWVYKGLAILLIGCPCALVLSTPAAITSGISTGARHGLLIKGGAVLEAIGKVRTVAFDKTGTLSAGAPKVTNIVPFIGTETTMLKLAAAVEAGSSHPLATAITKCAEGLTLGAVTGSKALRGQGVRAMVGNVDVVVASPRYAAEITSVSAKEAAQIETFEEDGKTVAAVLADGVLLGIIAMRDELREDAVSSMATLKRMNIAAIMLTGDNARTGKALGAQLGIEVKAELLPEDKLKAIEALRVMGPVAMVGDGINDAPALARADVGIAMGGGTDVALQTADAALLHQRVSDVPALIDLSRATMKNIYQNISIALGLKAVFLVTTLWGVTSLWMAIMADTGATVLVTLNALRLLGYTPKR
ncbi:MAG: heavy metal translocating P-type ATPase [Rhodobacteraceae bacterium]|nr:heavy metal translocating P-type ATPase [Paracoccaceae bacterium]